MASTDDPKSVGGKRQLRFAIVTDSHIEPEHGPDGASVVPLPRPNLRSRCVVAELDRLAPSFVVHLGDLVHPVPELAGSGPAREAFATIFGELACPLHLTAGNHDIGDKSAPWMPCKTVDAAAIARFERRFGPTHSAFDHGDCHFVLINTPVLNSGLPLEREQKAWLEADLAAHRGERIFLLTHYPPYLLDPDEPSHYDNIDPPARHWLLALIDEYRVEALFCGHVHNFFHHRYRHTDCYVVPSTSFVRAEYTELYRIGPSSEFGRDESGKFGFFVVDVFESGHIVRLHKTHGRVADGREHSSRDQLEPIHPRETAAGSLGVHLRHPWAEVVELPHNFPMEEFRRRRVRNDHPIQLLWDLAIRKLRVPLDDLADERVRERMRLLERHGHEFTVFSFGAPPRPTCELVMRHRELVSTWEIVVPPGEEHAAAAAIGACEVDGLRMDLSPLQTSANDPIGEESGRFYLGSGANLKRYFAGCGFGLDETDRIAALFADASVAAAFDGVVFRLGPVDDPWSGIAAIGGVAARSGLRTTATVTLAPEVQRADNRDDRANARRVAKAVFAAHAIPGVDVFVDTLIDIDRGFYTRNGLADRRYEARPAGAVLRHLHAALAWLPTGHRAESFPLGTTGTLYVSRFLGGCMALVIAEDKAPLELDALPVAPSGAATGTARRIDLATGAITRLEWRLQGDRISLDRTAPYAGPELVVVGPLSRTPNGST